MKHIPSQQEVKRFLAVVYSESIGCQFKGSYDSFIGNGIGTEDGEGYGRGYSDNLNQSGIDYGCGVANNRGSKNGTGEGYGISYGKGNENGTGYGNGNGFDDIADYNKDITFINGYRVYIIDCTPTLIYQIRDNYAKGAILNSDLTLTPCFIARVGNCFAHGETLHEAVQDAQEKAIEDSPLEERIQQFIQKYPDPDKPVPFAELFNWHHTLTGSCRLGREQFVEQHQLDTNAEYSPRFFIELTKDDFGGEIIEQLAEAYNITLDY